MPGESAWQCFGQRSWDAAWTAEQQGRRIRSHSVMAWEERGAGTPRSNTAQGEFVAAFEEETEECGHSRGQSRSSADGEVRLSARIVQATKIPQGLVLWPDMPCIRVTATIDGRDVSCQEEVIDTHFLGSTAAPSTHHAPDEEGSSEARPGEIVLELQLPKAQAVIDGTFPSTALSIRVEVVVGRVVTATGSMDLSEELKASRSGSSTRRSALSLTGGGEIVCVVDLNRKAGMSASARQVFPTTRNVFEGDGSQTNDDEPLEAGPNGTHLEHFLDTIACWGVPGGPGGAASSGSVNSKSSRLAYPTPTEKTSSGEKDEERPLGTVEPSYPELVEWLGRTHPDPSFLRLALEKTNSYAFPLVEAPFLAALLKHSGLAGEAFQAVAILSTTNKGE